MANETTKPNLIQLVEAALFVAGRPLSISELQQSVLANFKMAKGQVLMILEELASKYQNSGIILTEVAGGWRFQSRPELAEYLSYLWQEKPQRYSRALLETLTIIAYRQPVTRGEIEAIRGVAVSSSIISTLKERLWIKEVGHKEVPGRPALLATTKEFLDYFNLKSLSELPELDQSLLEKIPQDFQT
ncbi:SMC-Scp complex subunit ScpB [Celerinatantimonas sp. MCCC 1A17872]|uniref:SMC-Scp complex subunit ScpB n=1 Tax=Celerinatantimonas sp. MCCC 1A17872 TaxID=3177514 RepID=UPI0038C16384